MDVCKSFVQLKKHIAMVRIIDYKEREREDGEVFLVLELQGGIEMVRSQITDKFYATVRKTTIPATFDEETCKTLIGQELPGKIEQVKCDLYEFTIKDTGEVIQLDYRYEYIPEEEGTVQQRGVERSRSTIEGIVPFQDLETSFSSNGVQ